MIETIATARNLRALGKPLRASDNQLPDKRLAMRYELSARVEFCWMDDKGVSHHGTGRTRDISTRGCHILGTAWPTKGTLIALNIEIPFSPDGNRTLRIETEGRVVRVESPGNEGALGGFSVRNDRLNAYQG